MSNELTPIPGFEGAFSATQDGRIWSHERSIRTGRDCTRVIKGKWLKTANSRGYRVVGLKHDFQISVHRLIAMTFLERSPGKDHVNHKNGIKSDNRVENLEWCTQGENNAHAKLIGLTRAPRKIAAEQAAEIRRLVQAGRTQREISRVFGVGRSTIQRVFQGTHGYDAI